MNFDKIEKMAVKGYKDAGGKDVRKVITLGIYFTGVTGAEMRRMNIEQKSLYWDGDKYTKMDYNTYLFKKKRGEITSDEVYFVPVVDNDVMDCLLLKDIPVPDQLSTLDKAPWDAYVAGQINKISSDIPLFIDRLYQAIIQPEIKELE